MKSPTDKEWKEFQERVKEKNQDRNIVGLRSILVLQSKNEISYILFSH